MKQRLIIILVFVLVGIFIIDIYIRTNYKEEPSYLELDYKINYKENTLNPSLYLTENNLYKYYFVHYDEFATIIYENNDKFPLLEAYQKGYILLGDLLKEINIKKEPKFSFSFSQNTKKPLTLEYQEEDYQIFYYQIDNIKCFGLEDEIELIKALEDILIFFESHLKEENDDFKTYIYKEIKVIIDSKEENIYFGNHNLTEKIIKRGGKKWVNLLKN